MAAADLEAGTELRRRVRRSALLWSLIAATFYLGFIVLAVMRGLK
jgi:uncharacterized membrane protein (DUF485 family)